MRAVIIAQDRVLLVVHRSWCERTAWAVGGSERWSSGSERWSSGSESWSSREHSPPSTRYLSISLPSLPPGFDRDIRQYTVIFFLLTSSPYSLIAACVSD